MKHGPGLLTGSLVPSLCQSGGARFVINLAPFGETEFWNEHPTIGGAAAGEGDRVSIGEKGSLRISALGIVCGVHAGRPRIICGVPGAVKSWCGIRWLTLRSMAKVPGNGPIADSDRIHLKASSGIDG